MNCRECRERLFEYSEGLLDEGQMPAMAGHLRTCAACRAEADALMKLHRRLVSDAWSCAFVSLGASVMEKVMDQREATTRHGRSMEMMLRYKGSFSLAAAAIVVMATLAITLWDRPGSKAYALEGMVEASHGVQTVHVVDEVPVAGEVTVVDVEPEGTKLVKTREMWAQYDGKGEASQVRVTIAAGKDARTVTWNGDSGKVSIVSRPGGKVSVTDGASADVRLPEGAVAVRSVARNLSDAVSSGHAKIEIEKPSDDGRTVEIVASYPSKGTRQVLYVDANSKLIKRLDTYSTRDGRETLTLRRTFLDYNKPMSVTVVADASAAGAQGGQVTVQSTDAN
jgi:hypothetical protein